MLQGVKSEISKLVIQKWSPKVTRYYIKIKCHKEYYLCGMFHTFFHKYHRMPKFLHYAALLYVSV